MTKLAVVVTSTRPGRVGLPVGEWVFERAKAHGKFDVEFVDLKEVDLPLFNEPKHPRFGDYEFEHTKAWSRTVKAADVFVFVVPEYNFAMPPTLLNALDYLSAEWAYKACSLVSYGGISAGLRSAQMVKQVVTSLKMMPITDAVNIPFVAKEITPEGKFSGGEVYARSAAAMFDELLKWDTALSTLRKG